MMESTIARKETTLVLMGIMILLLVTTVEGLGNLGLPRSNFGVYFQDRGELAASASFWHHHIVVDMPKLADVIPATCMIYINSNVRPNNYSMEECSAYIEGNTRGLHGMLIEMNLQVIRKFDQLASVTTNKLAKIPRKGARSRRTRSAPLSFIGDLSKSLFGTARQDDLELVAKKVNQLIARGQDIGATLAAHEENFQSYMAVNNKRFDSLKGVVATNHMAIENIANQTWSRVIDFESSNTLLIQQQNETNFILSHLNDLKKSIMSMPAGVFPQLLVSSEQIRSAGNHIKKVLRKSNQDSAILHTEPDYFYKHQILFWPILIQMVIFG